MKSSGWRIAMTEKSHSKSWFDLQPVCCVLDKAISLRCGHWPKSRDGKTRGRCGRVRAIFFLGCANFLTVYCIVYTHKLAKKEPCYFHCAISTVRKPLCHKHCAIRTLPKALCYNQCAISTLCYRHCAIRTVP